MGWIKNWRRKRLLEQYAIAPHEWTSVVAALPLLQGLPEDALERLRVLATVFLHEKSIEPVQGLEMTAPMRLNLAAQAVLPILNLGMDWYEGWTSLVVYPDEFLTRQEWVDEAGVMHTRREIRSGEAWERGPVVLSWADVAASGHCDGYNAVIHEMAHKLDMRNGSADGCPRLHRDMRASAWRAAFQPAYEDLCQRADTGQLTALDPYAAEGPEEFFAVVSEYFFERPALLKQEYPAVYEQLAAFYRQNPIARLST
ncbi:MAG: zinc-dependent peptidase [Methylophilaceae bacterium]|nr:zinc-dependent peptidase [Methylophilaceae bacterium]